MTEKLVRLRVCPFFTFLSSGGDVTHVWQIALRSSGDVPTTVRHLRPRGSKLSTVRVRAPWRWICASYGPVLEGVFRCAWHPERHSV